MVLNLVPLFQDIDNINSKCSPILKILILTLDKDNDVMTQNQKLWYGRVKCLEFLILVIIIIFLCYF